ncbi:MAG: TIM44-like domain-containing protein [Marinospirillum sp.]|nr:TIM44-like domain-containing protein [Marinospirillum sp.]
MTLGINEADARRMGGGSSSGLFSRQANPPAQQQQRQQSQQQRQQPGSTAAGRSLMGPLMGLAAGGLLAAIFFGGAFEGIQFFDILILLLIVGGVFLFLRSRAKPQPQAATGQPSAGISPNQFRETGFDGAPDWFDEPGFIERAKIHFMDLQKAWDANDFSKLEEFVTPQLCRFLQEERARQPEDVKTEVRKLAAEISNIQQLDDTVELAVKFRGIISETGAPEASFCEIWHLIRDMSQENSPWLIQGIEQVE